jgi:hypothetical protein
METLFIYFLKANGLLITFFLVYYFLLRKETFFTKNRWFLILGLVASVLLPLITFTTIVWVEPTPIVYKPTSFESIPYLIENQIKEIPFDWNSFFVYAYILISVVFLAKMIIELFSFFRIIKVGNRSKSNQTILIDTNQNTNPFSFFKYIVFNSKLFSAEELHHIISHENIHVKEKHSIDVLLGKLFCAIFWINPIIWFYRKGMLQNLEYIADNKASSIAQNRINYQKTLLKVVTNQHQLTITNQFYQSLIKKRIVMLNTKQSNQKKSWKYVLILPVLSAFMLLFQVETVAQVKENPLVKTSYVVSTGYTSTVTRNTTNQELKEVEASFSDENQKLIISNVKRNKKGEIIEIKLLFDTGKTYHRVMERISKEPIDPIEIFIKTDKDGNKDCGFEEIDLSAIYAEEIFEVKNIPKFKDISLDNLTKNGKNVILIINGKIKGATEKVKIPFDEELGEMKEISAAEFEKKYNQKAAKNNLYYEVETYKLKTVTGSWKDAMEDSKEGEENKPNSIKSFKENEAGNSEKSINNKYNVTIGFDELGERNQIKKTKEHKNVDYKKALLIFDGKEINREDLDKIDETTIASSAVMTATKYALDKYGEKGKYGVIELKSQKYLEETDLEYNTILKNYNSKKEDELKARQNSKLADEEIDERTAKRNKLIEERKEKMEERKIEYEKRKEKVEERTENLIKEKTKKSSEE